MMAPDVCMDTWRCRRIDRQLPAVHHDGTLKLWFVVGERNRGPVLVRGGRDVDLPGISHCTRYSSMQGKIHPNLRFILVHCGPLPRSELCP